MFTYVNASSHTNTNASVYMFTYVNASRHTNTNRFHIWQHDSLTSAACLISLRWHTHTHTQVTQSYNHTRTHGHSHTHTLKRQEVRQYFPRSSSSSPPSFSFSLTTCCGSCAVVLLLLLLRLLLWLWWVQVAMCRVEGNVSCWGFRVLSWVFMTTKHNTVNTRMDTSSIRLVESITCLVFHVPCLELICVTRLIFWSHRSVTRLIFWSHSAHLCDKTHFLKNLWQDSFFMWQDSFFEKNEKSPCLVLNYVTRLIFWSVWQQSFFLSMWQETRFVMDVKKLIHVFRVSWSFMFRGPCLALIYVTRLVFWSTWQDLFMCFVLRGAWCVFRVSKCLMFRVSWCVVRVDDEASTRAYWPTTAGYAPTPTRAQTLYQCLVFDLWSLVFGVWCLVFGVGCLWWGVNRGYWPITATATSASKPATAHTLFKCLVFGVWCLVFGVECGWRGVNRGKGKSSI